MSHNLLIFHHQPGLADYVRRIGEALPDLSIQSVSSLDDCEAKLPEADILLAFGAHLRKRDIYPVARRLKWVQALGTGMDGIVDMPGLAPDVLVTATRGIHGHTLAEMGIMLMLALLRDLPRSIRNQDKRDFTVRWPAKLMHNRTVGILGVGAISEVLAPMLKAFGMHVIGFTRTPRELPGFDRFVPREALVETAPELDFLFLLIPATEATEGIINRDVLWAMKPTAYVINLARGQVVDEDAMAEALMTGRIAGAGLDTFVHEPLPRDHMFWDCPNVILTPHLAGFNTEYGEAASAQFVANYRAWCAGRLADMTFVERGPVL
jgi:D-2-hydroxyacid dehydrogenase (NADP+)